MIQTMIRRYAVSVQIETGRSLQEILQEFVAAVRDGHTIYSAINFCTACGSKNTRITITRRKELIIDRTHRCDLCGVIFHSEEKLPEPEPLTIPRIEEPQKAVVKRKKKK